MRKSPPKPPPQSKTLWQITNPYEYVRVTRGCGPEKTINTRVAKGLQSACPTEREFWRAVQTCQHGAVIESYAQWQAYKAGL